jgi:hypothetical protein
MQRAKTRVYARGAQVQRAELFAPPQLNELGSTYTIGSAWKDAEPPPSLGRFERMPAVFPPTRRMYN